MIGGIIFELVCDVYETNDIPIDYKVKKTVTIPKKVGDRQMQELPYYKPNDILTTIIHRRTKPKIESSLSVGDFLESDAGFVWVEVASSLI